MFAYFYNGLPVCRKCERVNRYTVIFNVMLTDSQGMVRCSWIEKAVVDADWSLERKGA